MFSNKGTTNQQITHRQVTQVVQLQVQNDGIPDATSTWNMSHFLKIVEAQRASESHG